MKEARIIIILALVVIFITSNAVSLYMGAASERQYNGSERSKITQDSEIYSVEIYQDGTAYITTNQKYLQEPIEGHVLVITDRQAEGGENEK